MTPFTTPLPPPLRHTLRLEGAAVAVAATLAYAHTGHSWLLFAGLLLTPDLFMAGYLRGPRVGARLYNIGHTYTTPLALAAAGWLSMTALPLSLSLIWVAHIGMDRAAGYGLKYPTGFRRSHLSSPD
ncbi:DUF4260 domain-containing protein [Jannaschia pohangensis]|uniref:DUF4260 domain-containing protein n=1 Tax=Jannaschia pohangensis TaxID=390807 RepID=A0A1I3QXS7_9RHOB|nr:DUF4260 domain-containing protein [Jannaschia pohangensis]SFJ37957.1 protein of unknown function [Jannaschia pohangensis]